MKVKREKYYYPEIGKWLQETIQSLGFINQILIDDTNIRKESFYELLKGGIRSTVIGYVFSTSLWMSLTKWKKNNCNNAYTKRWTCFLKNIKIFLRSRRLCIRENVFEGAERVKCSLSAFLFTVRGWGGRPNFVQMLLRPVPTRIPT